MLLLIYFVSFNLFHFSCLPLVSFFLFNNKLCQVSHSFPTLYHIYFSVLRNFSAIPSTLFISFSLSIFFTLFLQLHIHTYTHDTLTNKYIVEAPFSPDFT